MQRYAVKAVLGRIAHIREVLLLTVDLRGFQGNVEHGCLNVETGSWNQATQNMEAGIKQPRTIQATRKLIQAT